MTVTLNFAPEVEAVLRDRAARAGQSLEGYIQHLVEQEARAANGSPATAPPAAAIAPSADRTFDEILAPVRQGFQESGLTEEELKKLFEEAREEVWQQQERQEGQR
jgi:hypothetical protein